MNKLSSDDDTVMIQTKMPAALRRRLVKAAADCGVSTAVLVRDAIERRLDALRPEGP